MAEQEGILPYSGKLGDTVGYRIGKKHFKRAKPASYQPGEESQKSGVEFGEGSKACVILKHALKPLILKNFKPELHNRLATVMREVIRSGPIAKKGERGVFDGNLKLLKGFELHPKTNFFNLCSVAINSKINSKEVLISFPSLKWESKIKAPSHAEIVKMGLCVVFVDFNAATAQSINANQIVIQRNQTFPGGSLKINIPEKEELAVLLVINLFFESDYGKQAYIIENQNYQTGVILDVAHIKNGELVSFISEILPEKPVEPIIQPESFWQLKDDH